jgi:hypothetical protein
MQPEVLKARDERERGKRLGFGPNSSLFSKSLLGENLVSSYLLKLRRDQAVRQSGHLEAAADADAQVMEQVHAQLFGGTEERLKGVPSLDSLHTKLVAVCRLALVQRIRNVANGVFY